MCSSIFALSFITAVLQRLEHVLRQQQLGLGSHARALEPVRIGDGTHLDHAIGRIDPHQRKRTHDLVATLFDDDEGTGILARLQPFQLRLQGLSVGHRHTGKVGPIRQIIKDFDKKPILNLTIKAGGLKGVTTSSEHLMFRIIYIMLNL